VTQVDFYVLKSSSDDAWLRLACRIAEKALLKEKHVFIHTDKPPHSQRLDEVLWTFSPGSFVPHRIVDDDNTADASEPVLIGTGSEPTGERWDVLINLGNEVPEFFSRYDRIAEVVDGNTERREFGRKRFRFYRDRGYKLDTHNIE